MARFLKVDMFCLVETQVKEENADSIIKIIVPGWKYLCNYLSHGLGRIRVCWKEEFVSVQLFQSSSQVISCKVKFDQGKRDCFMSLVDVFTKGVERDSLWVELEMFKESIGDQPWLLARDFNVVKSPDEKLDGVGLNTYEQEFCSCLYKIEVMDVTRGVFFYLG